MKIFQLAGHPRKEWEEYEVPSLAQEKRGYVLGSSRTEHDRLNRQGQLIAKITRHFLEEMPLRAGMRVLDVGSGVGDLALLAACMVGPEGEVVGIDLDESALQVARIRAAEEKLGNVDFHVATLQDYGSGTLFDAVIGRCVLLHQHDPLTALASVARHVRSGGIIGFQEPWFAQGFSLPRMPLFEEVSGWLHDSVRESGLDGDIGLRLPSIFALSELPSPELSFEMLVDCRQDPAIWEFVVDTVRSLLPRLEQLGITDAGQVQIDTLAARLREEQARLRSTVGMMPLMGAWCKKS